MSEPMTWEELKSIQQRLSECSMQIATKWPTIMVVADRIGTEAETAMHLMAPTYMIPGLLGAAMNSTYKCFGGEDLTEEDRKQPECAGAFLAYMTREFAGFLSDRFGFERRQLMAQAAFLLLQESMKEDDEEDDEDAGTD